MKKGAPEINLVKICAGKYLRDIIHVERVPKGWSTYVYRVIADSGTYYVRFLPEDASFAAEVLAHNILLDRGVIVPRVIGFEHKDKATGLSVMITAEIPGVSVEDEWPEKNLHDILHEAGKQIALVHEVPVDGFGWIDRTSYDRLKGINRTFQIYFTELDSHNLRVLEEYELTDEERHKIGTLIIEAKSLLDIEDAVLVHGDFDASHIFHLNGMYTGIIDWGEIRGHNRLFDLATCALFDNSTDRTVYRYVLEGYREKVSLTDDDLYAIELMVLVRAIAPLVKRDPRSRLRDYFFDLAKKQLDRINAL